MCPYTVMYELSKEQAEPMEPTVMRAAVATNITLRPTMSAKDPANNREEQASDGRGERHAILDDEEEKKDGLIDG